MISARLDTQQNQLTAAQSSQPTSDNSVLSRQESHQLQMVMSQFANPESKLSQAQLTALIKQRDKAMDYQHADTQKMLAIEGGKAAERKWLMLGIGIFAILFIAVVGYFDKNNVAEMIKLLSVFAGGGGLGYVYGNKGASKTATA
jgi:nitrate reductase NapE component